MHNPATAQQYSKSDWDEVRLAFYNSIMVDSHLNSLAQNAELDAWPIERPGETPSKYVDFSWEEIHELPGLAEHPERVELLITILKDTLSFDDPFGDMVETIETATNEDDALERNLKDLQIPSDLPLRFGGLSSETLDFCESEGARTIGEFAQFAESMAQNVLVGGDFKEILNALIMKDEQNIARFLPFRPNEKGVHLIEAIGLAVHKLSPRERDSLIKRYGGSLESEQAPLSEMNLEKLIQVEDRLIAHTEAMTHYFSQDTKNLRGQLDTGANIERSLVMLNDEATERIASFVLKSALGCNKTSLLRDIPTKRRGFFSWLFRRD